MFINKSLRRCLENGKSINCWFYGDEKKGTLRYHQQAIFIYVRSGVGSVIEDVLRALLTNVIICRYMDHLAGYLI